MTGRSILPLLLSPKSGQIDPARDYVVTGRERHVANAREGDLPYPQRSIRTRDFLYIRNFAPDRWPMGTPNLDGKEPTFDALENNTFVAFADLDASPTKAWMVANRKDPEWQMHWRLGFEKRPAEELYDLAKDPDYLTNVADDPPTPKPARPSPSVSWTSSRPPTTPASTATASPSNARPLLPADNAPGQPARLDA